MKWLDSCVATGSLLCDISKDWSGNRRLIWVIDMGLIGFDVLFLLRRFWPGQDWPRLNVLATFGWLARSQ